MPAVRITEEPTTAGTLGGIWRGISSLLVSPRYPCPPASPRGAGAILRQTDHRDESFAGPPESANSTPPRQLRAYESIAPRAEPLMSEPEDLTRASSPPRTPAFYKTSRLVHSASSLPNSAPVQLVPHIFRIIPPSGPISGCIEISVLGSGFPSHNACTFGGSIALTVWETETARLCILPGNHIPGPVRVSFQDVPDTQTTQTFTYVDTRENDACVCLHRVLNGLPDGAPFFVIGCCIF